MSESELPKGTPFPANPEARRAHFENLRAEAEALAAQAGPDTPPAQRADLFLLLATRHGALGDHVPAIEAYESALPLLDELGRTADAAQAAHNLAYHLAWSDRREAALERMRDVRERRRKQARQPDLLMAYWLLGHWHRRWGQIDEAEAALRTAIQQARTWGDPLYLGTCLLELGRTLRHTERLDRALLAYTEAVSCLAGRDERLHQEAVEALKSIDRVPFSER